MGRLGAIWGRPGRILGRTGASWGRLGASWGRLEGVFGMSWGVLGRHWNILGPSWGISFAFPTAFPPLSFRFSSAFGKLRTAFRDQLGATPPDKSTPEIAHKRFPESIKIVSWDLFGHLGGIIRQLGDVLETS